MAIQKIESVKRIEQQFRTGEEPVLVMCSDVSVYVCKYMRSSAAAFKLACELIGARMAEAWHLNSPDIALVRIKSSHWSGINQSHSISAPSIGSRWLEKATIQTIVDHLRVVYHESLQRASVQVDQIIEDMPEEWNVPQNVVKEKLLQLFDERWTAEVWDNFMECLNDNTKVT